MYFEPLCNDNEEGFPSVLFDSSIYGGFKRDCFAFALACSTKFEEMVEKRARMCVCVCSREFLLGFVYEYVLSV